MTKSSEDFSCDLVSEAKRHLLFLKMSHALGVSLQRPSDESLRRYSKLWLPLVGLESKDILDKGFREGLSLIPPPDIAWLWHCHRLAPFLYTEYVNQELDMSDKMKLLNPSAPFALQMDPDRVYQLLPSYQSDSKGKFLWINHSSAEDVKETRRLWNTIYPKEAFFTLSFPQDQSAQADKDVTEENDGILGLLHSYNLRDAAIRQSTFLWQVQGQQYNDDNFLQQGVINYHKFILLKSIETGKNQLIVPTYQIDLIWHTHILFSIEKYNDDCIKVSGSKMNHDDSINDRHEGGLLDLSFKATKKLWEQTYGESYSVAGGMFLGDPPEAFFRPEDSEGIQIAAASELENNERWMSSMNFPGFSRENPHSSSYIYGNSANGWGYYHLKTKDAYTIIEKELLQDLADARCFSWFCWPYSYLCCKHAAEQLKSLESSLSAVRYQIHEIDAPSNQLQLPQYFLIKIQKPRTYNEVRGRNRYKGSGGGCGGACGGGCGGG